MNVGVVGLQEVRILVSLYKIKTVAVGWRAKEKEKVTCRVKVVDVKGRAELEARIILCITEVSPTVSNPSP